MKTRPSEHCFDNCKPYELKLKEELNITTKNETDRFNSR